MPDNFVVYKSSAGSGKTYTLVKEYLKLALADPHRLNKAYKQILAVTFTNKAAAEMKERILTALKQIAALEKTPLAADLQKELFISETELQARCKEVHQNLLHQYADFSVCTIDSFVYRLIKRFSIDLQLPANFTVDTDEDAALWWAIDELLTNMKQNKLLQNLLLNYASDKVDEQKNWKIENEIFELARPILISKKDTKEAELLGKVSLEDLLEIKKQLQESVRKTEHYLIGLADKAYLTIAQNGVSIEDFRYGKSGFFSYFKKIKEKKFASDELANKYVNDAINEDKWYTGKNANGAIDGIKETLRSIYYEVESYREKNISEYFLHKLLLKNITALCVLNEIQELVLKYKQEKNIVFISEFNTTVSSFIQDEPVPFIYERLGDRYKHYLIDEFQDTSVLQWLNLLPLVHNSLAEGKFCMIVGDGKQSIYRWRGADVDQFVNLPKIKSAEQNRVIQEQQQALELNYQEKQLNTNRRSCAEIIGFNNNLFD
ncbi:MAG: UvrD-helicase domain-containing protein, partial [Bacteroidia bacterium]